MKFARKLLFVSTINIAWLRQKFAAMLKGRKASMICAGKYDYSSGQLEEANSKIKVLKQTAYGYRTSSTSR
ncbi:MAG: transposase [Burkholderiales bacterium]|mgnify:CR=1|uniref:transposase n=1 Tax=uncultured Turicimonas sp. TaxID=1918607 RepID=UPI001ECBF2BD|nr:transposase [uncultured Turicimonas sp.]MBS4845513.1 transposase [Burkholderiales bacterium]